MTITASIVRFGKNRSGATVMFFALSFVPMAFAAGMAIDYAGAVRLKSKLQSSLDAAVLAGVAARYQDVEASPASNAQKIFAKNMGQEAPTATFAFNNGVLSGQASQDAPTTLTRILGFTSIPIAVKTAATAVSVREPVCFMAMHPTRKHTLELDDSVSVIAPDCHIYGNSDHPDDVVDPHQPENFLVGKSVQAMGYGHHYIGNVTPPLEYAPELISDPLATLPVPVSGACTFNGVTKTGGAHVLTPGVYCGGLTINGGANVAMLPGLYIIRGGSFKVDTGIVTGQGVTISLADSNAVLNWQNGTIRLRAPATGVDAGFAILGQRVEAQHTFTNSVIDIYGVVYMPNGDMVWSNTGEAPGLAKWTVWMVDGVSWKGSGKIKISFDIENADIPYPDALRHVIPRPGKPRLLENAQAN